MIAEPEQYLVDSRGKKTEVILSLERYQQLLEDIHDLAVVAERRDEDTVTLDELTQRLEQDGLL